MTDFSVTTIAGDAPRHIRAVLPHRADPVNILVKECDKSRVH
jgi:hypothetical protein